MLPFRVWRIIRQKDYQDLIEARDFLKVLLARLKAEQHEELEDSRAQIEHKVAERNNYGGKRP